MGRWTQRDAGPASLGAISGNEVRRLRRLGQGIGLRFVLPVGAVSIGTPWSH